MEININKDIREYTEGVFFGLNLRQLICSGLAVALCVGGLRQQGWAGLIRALRGG